MILADDFLQALRTDGAVENLTLPVITILEYEQFE
jgi:hypothetical protein